MNQHWQFSGGRVHEHQDGSASLEVRTVSGAPFLIHFAPHVWADLCSLIDRRRAIGGVANTRPALESRLRAEKKEATRV